MGFGLLCPAFGSSPRRSWSFCLVHQALSPLREVTELPCGLRLELNKAEEHRPFLGAQSVSWGLAKHLRVLPSCISNQGTGIH